MINRKKFKKELVEAEKGDETAITVVREVLRPLPTDSVEDIVEKLTLYIRIVFLKSLLFKDAPFHKDIDYAYAEQIHSYLQSGVPRYEGIMVIGYRESAKTTRIKMVETYMAVYLPEFSDLYSVVSEDGRKAQQFNMDMFNTFAFSKVGHYFNDLIALEERSKKKQSQTMTHFTTTTGVTLSAASARKTNRGDVKMEVDEAGEVLTERPKRTIFDDIENETTIRSLQATLHIRAVMNASIDGLDQLQGFWVILGNYLSLRGNIAHYRGKHKGNSNVKIILIPILDAQGNPTWEDKYVRTDKEALALRKKGITKKSIEALQATSENFETEFMNNPARNLVYFDDKLVSYLEGYNRVGEGRRNVDGLLIIQEPEPTGVYIMGADSAKGTGGDQSAFTIFKTSGQRYEEVANFKNNKMKPEDFAPYCANLATKYNNALIIPENNYPNNEVIAFLRQVYKNIYKVQAGDRVEYGVHTNLKTKPEMFLNLKRLLKDRLLEAYSDILYEQILEYPAQDLHVIQQKDGSGGHYDVLMSAAVCLYKAPTIGQDNVGNDAAVDARIRAINNAAFSEPPTHR